MPFPLSIFSRSSVDGTKERIGLALTQIEVQRKELEQLRLRLTRRRASLFGSTVRAIEQNDEMRARVLSQEHVELLKVERVMNTAELSLLHISSRLETLRDVGDVMFALSSAFKAAKHVGKSVREAVPRLDATASEINDSFTNIIAELGVLSPNVSVGLSDTPEEIFSKAQLLIQEKTSEISDLPKSLREEVDIEESALERTKRIALIAAGDEDAGSESTDADEFRPVILSSRSRLTLEVERAIERYVREKGKAKIDILECSARLNLPVDLVEQAYIKLLSKEQFRPLRQANDSH